MYSRKEKQLVREELRNSRLKKNTTVVEIHEQIMKDILRKAKLKTYYQPGRLPVSKRFNINPDYPMDSLRVNGQIALFNPHGPRQDWKNKGVALPEEIEATRGLTKTWCTDNGFFYHIFITAAPDSMLRGAMVEGLDGNGGEVWQVKNGIKDPNEQWQKEKKAIEDHFADLKRRMRVEIVKDDMLVEALVLARRLREDPVLKSRLFDRLEIPLIKARQV